LVGSSIEFLKTHDIVVLVELQPEPLRSALDASIWDGSSNGQLTPDISR
jgi:hypothetical protein